MVEMRVRSKVNCNSMAAAIAGCFENGVDTVKLSAIGAHAINAGVKAVAIASNIMSQDGAEYTLYIIPAFRNKIISGEVVTVMDMIVGLHND